MTSYSNLQEGTYRPTQSLLFSEGANAMSSLLTALRRSVPLSLRLQLTVWYTTAFAVLLLLTGAVFYQYLESSLEASIDTDLQLRAQQIASDLVLQQGRPMLHDLTIALPGLDTASPTEDHSAADVNAGTLVRLLDAYGTLLGETSAFRELRVLSASVTQPLQGTPWQGTVLSTSDQEVRLYCRRLVSVGKSVAVIQVGVSLTALHTLLHRLVAALLLVGFLVLAFCAAGSYWLAAYSFAPIQQLAEAARKIKEGDLHQRVPVSPVRDEVQYLAVTLNEMLDSLDQSFSRQRRFVADASHELRTPVAVIRNKADVALLHFRTSQQYCTVLQSISTETRRLSHLISDLLALARGDEGQVQWEDEPVRFDWLVESVVASAQGLAHERGIQLAIQESRPITLIGDETRLIQVIMNLLDNAIRYTHAGGHVQVSLSTSASHAQLVVRDTGIGIAQEHLPHIFERFYRADPSRKRTGSSGTGLGLAIVEWIVRKHAGSVRVSSQIGQGSCFTVVLPLASKTDGLSC